MINRIENFIAKHRLFNKKTQILVAVSGGMDSMFLIDYLFKNQYSFAVAHCNFKLRNNESDEDASFVSAHCEQNNIPYFTEAFETEKYASTHKLSIQEAARNLRYEWLESIRKNNGFECIATAHHLDDNIETLLFNLVKGTGIKGLRGMLPRNGKVVRPLLEIDREYINEYVAKNKIAFREDSSNLTTKYHRNKIRQLVVPVLKEINPGLTDTMTAHFENFTEIEKLHNHVIAKYRKQLFENKVGYTLIPIQKLLKIDGYKTLTFELLSPFGFNRNQVETLLGTVDSSEFKMILSDKYRVVKDKKHFVVTEITEAPAAIQYITEKTKQINLTNGDILKVHFKPADKNSKIIPDADYAFLDVDKLTLPITIRNWKDGDYFYPITADGKPKKKKVSKFFKDEKTPVHIKENCPVLVSGQFIVWVCGFRLDDRFKITDKTRNILKLTLVKK
jgi:tRNA(Ile)-lysidine synthase